MTDTNIDFEATNWWTTVSGVNSWQSDYTKSRSGKSTTYTSTDALYGRNKTGPMLDHDVLFS